MLLLTLSQELESLRSQVQSQSAEMSQLKTENQDLLRRAETVVTNKPTNKHYDTGAINDPFHLKSIMTWSLVFCQVVDSGPSGDGSVDVIKLAELESRLAAQTSETERLKVWEASAGPPACFSSWPPSAPGGGERPEGGTGGAGAAARLSHQHGGHPADREIKAANRSSGVQEGAGRPADAAGGPGPEDPHPQTKTERSGRIGTNSSLTSCWCQTVEM